MKKIFVLTLALVMALSCLTGCGDPVAAEYENFLNVYMVDVNAKYEEIKAEVATWADFENDAQYADHLKNTLIPLCDETLGMLEGIQLETEEVKDLKTKFTKVIELYKEGFSLILAGAELQSEDELTKGNAKLEEGIAALDEYNKGLEELATQTGYTVEY